MTTAAGFERYLLCRAGDYAIAVRSQTILRIWQRGTATQQPSFTAEQTIDLRGLLGTAGGPEAGVGIAFEMPDRTATLIIDAVSSLAQIANAEFVELPRVFGFARTLFNSACRRHFDGSHPLRLRSELLIGDLPVVT